MRQSNNTILLGLLLATCLQACFGSINTKGRLIELPDEQQSQVDRHLKPKKIALLVGIDQFEDDAWHTLRFAAKDATDMAEFLASSQGGNFDQVITLTNPDQTDKKAIHKAVSSLSSINKSPRDTVLVYMSSHGTLAYRQDGQLGRYVVTQDSQEKNVADTAVAVEQLIRKLDRLPSQRKVLMLAFCHSGHGKSRLSRHMQEELKKTKGVFFSKPMELDSAASVILSAASWGQTAQEDGRLKNDIYTHFFLEALKNKKDLDANGAVTVSEAHEYAAKNTYAFTSGRQRPTAQSDILGADPIVLAGRIASVGEPVLQSFHPDFDGVEVTINGQSKGKFPGLFVLPKGKVEIALSNLREEKQQTRIHLEAKSGTIYKAESLDVYDFDYTFSTSLGIAYVPTPGNTRLFNTVMPQLSLDFSMHKALFQADGIVSLSALGHAKSAQMADGADVDQDVFGMHLQAGLAWDFFDWLKLSPRLGLLYLQREYTLCLSPNETGEKTKGKEIGWSPMVGGLVSASWDISPSWYLTADLGAFYFVLKGASGLNHSLLLSAGLSAGMRF
jgi:hypothetical protein